MNPTDDDTDNRQELTRLYVEKDLTICEIADEHAEHEKTRVCNALCEYGIIEKAEDQETRNLNIPFGESSRFSAGRMSITIGFYEVAT